MPGVPGERIHGSHNAFPDGASCKEDKSMDNGLYAQPNESRHDEREGGRRETCLVVIGDTHRHRETEEGGQPDGNPCYTAIVPLAAAHVSHVLHEVRHALLRLQLVRRSSENLSSS